MVDGWSANVTDSVTHAALGHTSMPSSASGTFDRSIFENHLTTRAILGEVMWVASAPVNWAKSESLHIYIYIFFQYESKLVQTTSAK